MDPNLINTIGGIAGLCTTIAFFPQAVKIYQTRDTSSISLLMYIIFVLGLCFWILYGILSGQMAIIVPNCVTLLLASYILLIKILDLRKM